MSEVFLAPASIRFQTVKQENASAGWGGSNHGGHGDRFEVVDNRISRRRQHVRYDHRLRGVTVQERVAVGAARMAACRPTVPAAPGRLSTMNG